MKLRQFIRLEPDRRDWSLDADEIQKHDRLRCCVKGCRRLVCKSGSGWILPVCVAHNTMLTPNLFDQVELVAEASAFNPQAVLAAALLVKKIQARCEQVSRRGKAKRKP